MKNQIKIQEEDVIICDTLSWDEGWEFENPSMMISPIIRCYESGKRHESIVEDVMIDAVTSKNLELHGDNFEEQWGWRGYKLPVLRRRFKEALNGKSFPKAGYFAKREIIRIVKDKKGQLSWETIGAL